MQLESSLNRAQHVHAWHCAATRPPVVHAQHIIAVGIGTGTWVLVYISITTNSRYLRQATGQLQRDSWLNLASLGSRPPVVELSTSRSISFVGRPGLRQNPPLAAGPTLSLCTMSRHPPTRSPGQRARNWRRFRLKRARSGLPLSTAGPAMLLLLSYCYSTAKAATATCLCFRRRQVG